MTSSPREEHKSMVRPHSDKKIAFCPKFREFRPDSPECQEKIIEITEAEVEALRLKNIEELDQTESAVRMKISQSTFQRLLTSAYKKISLALVEGRPLIIIK